MHSIEAEQEHVCTYIRENLGIKKDLYIKRQWVERKSVNVPTLACMHQGYSCDGYDVPSKKKDLVVLSSFLVM